MLFDFTVDLIPLNFEFAPELPPPISKELLLKLAIRLSGTVYKYWTCYIWRGKQCVRRYVIPTPNFSSEFLAFQSKLAQGVLRWQNMGAEERDFWRIVGSNKKEMLPGYNAFLSAFLKGEVE